jgi:hypothetical protein
MFSLRFLRSYDFSQDDIHLHDYNVPDVVRSFIQAAHDEVCLDIEFEKKRAMWQGKYHR